jgi:hypothetical protein
MTADLVKAIASPSPAAVSSRRKKIALVLAGVADLVQLGYFPVFGEGALSPADDVLDVIVALLLLVTLGFKWRLAAALAIELVPGATLFPTWTAVVLSLPTYEEPAPAALPAHADD